MFGPFLLLENSVTPWPLLQNTSPLSSQGLVKFLSTCLELTLSNYLNFTCPIHPRLVTEVAGISQKHNGHG